MNIVSRQCFRIFQHDITQQNRLCLLGRALAYKSVLSLDKLYPTSNLKLYTPTFVPEDPNAKFNGYIPIEELKIKYSCSSGPGGQHVNRTNTKVDIRFHVKSATWLSEEIKEKLLDKYQNKINKDGYFIVKSELTRSQQLNQADALEKLRTVIREIVKPVSEVPPETQELRRKRMLAAARKRLHEKRMKSEHKWRPNAHDINF